MKMDKSSTKTFSLEEIPDFSKSERIIVVGVVGKSAYNCGVKAKSLRCNFSDKECRIECHWDETSNVLYLHLISLFDTSQLIQFVSGMGGSCETQRRRWEGSERVDDARKGGDFLVAAGDITTEFSKSLLLMFHLCHVIVLTSPTCIFDMSYVNLFKAIDAVRLEFQSSVCDLIKAHVPPSWGAQGRPCCPRVLFHMERCPPQLIRGGDCARVKVLEHSLEDQIYNILRKARVITNISANSLFAIPKNEEFVYINTEESSPGRTLTDMLRTLVMSCEGMPPLTEWFTQTSSRPTLREFLQTHLDLAFSTGFDDNVGKFATNSLFFEVPSAEVWRRVASLLHNHFLSPDSPAQWSGLWDALSIDTRFSQGRCTKVLPLAQAAYMENLPTHYSTQYHLQRVAVAVSVFTSMARGPLSDWYRTQLREECNNIWHSRRLCEKLSLTGNPCIKPKHSNPEELHSSGVRYVAACNCGRSKGSREDPYSVKSANWEFYQELGKDCQCGSSAETIPFPVFQPSTNDFKAANVKSLSVPPSVVKGGEFDTLSPPMASQWSQPSQEEGLSNAALSEGNPRGSQDSHANGEAYTLIAINDNHYNKDKGLVRQPSTTEYLPGMLHTESPPGLLPAFSSWSLVCVGPSSLYSHNIGLPENLRSGFLQYTNFLVPWDCSVSRMENISSWKSLVHQRGRKTPPSNFTVKIFLGMEYECPKGHRFMMSSNDTVVCGSSNLHKQSGAKLANTDMPIYYRCPCWGNKPMMAQLMRLHIVTPKAPVNITLNPKVQPMAGGPIFITGAECPILTGSAYWVLRLPYIYSTERGPLPRPSLPLPASSKGRLLQGFIGVTD